MRKLNEQELEKMHKKLFDLNTRKQKGEEVKFPDYTDEEMYQLRDWQAKKFLKK
jgi:hypothetical protein